MNHGEHSSPITAPMNRAAVAAPADPLGPRLSTSTGTTGSRIWKLTATDAAMAASSTEGRSRARAISELPVETADVHGLGRRGGDRREVRLDESGGVDEAIRKRRRAGA